MIHTGNRVPWHFFATSGVGQSDITLHAGSFHLALREAGIEMANIISYSSILPDIATEVDASTVPIRHGEVMETIMAVASCDYGETCTAGLIWGWLTDPATGLCYGGLVCEYSGSLPPEEADPHLRSMLDELHANGYEWFDLTVDRVLMRHIAPEKRHGTAIAAICFTDHVIPTLPLTRPAP